MLSIIAWGFVGSDGVMVNGRGAESARSSVGSYSLTLSDGLLIDDTEMMITITISGEESLLSPVVLLSANDQVKELQIVGAGDALIDSPFWFKIEKLNIL